MPGRQRRCTPTVRRLRPGDTAVVLGAPGLFVSPPQPEWVADLLADPTCLLYWASDDNGGALGYLLASLLPMPDSAEVFVYSMGIAGGGDSGSGSGSGNASEDSSIAEALLDKVAAYAEDSACSRVWGVPFPGNHLYDGEGGDTTGIDLPLG